MKLKTRNVFTSILIYFLIFSAFILGFLYLFQILFLSTYYEITQSNSLSELVEKIEKDYSKDKNIDLDTLSIKNDACIEIINGDEIIYSSKYSKHCGRHNSDLKQIKSNFIVSGKKNIKVEYINSTFNNKSLVFGKKLDNNIYVFGTTSLVPIDRSINLLKKQFIYVLLAVLILSFIISYLFAKKISNPIVKINNYAKKIAKNENKEMLNLKTEISELKELETTLNETVKELKKADETQKEFLANVGHDLKTPLTMIEAYASSAKDLNYNNKKKRENDLNIIIDEAERLNSLVNDILLLTKIQSSVTKPELEVFDITDYIKEILERFKIYENEGYTFIFKEKNKYKIKADKRLIARVIYNLIINAVNFTGDDKKVKIELEKIDDNLKIKIIDTGKGLSETEKNNVWNKYFKTDKKYHRNQKGTGLGLSIVKEIFTSHKFDYGIESKKGKGTTFYFICKINKE